VSINPLSGLLALPRVLRPAAERTAAAHNRDFCSRDFGPAISARNRDFCIDRTRRKRSAAISGVSAVKVLVPSVGDGAAGTVTFQEHPAAGIHIGWEGRRDLVHFSGAPCGYSSTPVQ